MANAATYAILLSGSLSFAAASTINTYQYITNSEKERKREHSRHSENSISSAILWSILVGSLKNTGKLILVKSFPILCFKTLHKLVLGLLSALMASSVRRLAYPP